MGLEIAGCAAIEMPEGINSNTYKVVVGCIWFCLFLIINNSQSRYNWVGRPGATLVAGTLMVIFVVIKVETVYNVIGCNLPLLFVVIGNMVFVYFLETRADLHSKFFNSFIFNLVRNENGDYKGGKAKYQLLEFASLYLFTTVYAAFLGWDTAALGLAKPTIDYSKKHNLDLKAYSIGLSIACNIGSFLTPVGNPGNTLVVLFGEANDTGMSFSFFFSRVVVIWVINVFLSLFVCLIMFYRKLIVTAESTNVDGDNVARIESNHQNSGSSSSNNANANANNEKSKPECIHENVELQPLPSINSTNNSLRQKNSHPMSSVSSGQNLETPISINTFTVYNEEEKIIKPIKSSSSSSESKLSKRFKFLKRLFYQYYIYFVIVAVIICYFFNLEFGLVAFSGAVIALVLAGQDFHSLISLSIHHHVVYYIMYIFVTMQAFIDTGVPIWFFNLVEPYISVTEAGPMIFLTIIILAYVQLVSNVPAVFILAPQVVNLAVNGVSQNQTYFFVAVVAGIGGALTPNGSITQLIIYGTLIRETSQPEIDCDHDNNNNSNNSYNNNEISNTVVGSMSET
eukprot:Pgem_evm1s6862